jgi:hypothetical protein
MPPGPGVWPSRPHAEADSILSASGTRARGLPQDEDTVRLNSQRRQVAVRSCCPSPSANIIHTPSASLTSGKHPFFLDMPTVLIFLSSQEIFVSHQPCAPALRNLLKEQSDQCVCVARRTLARPDRGAPHAITFCTCIIRHDGDVSRGTELRSCVCRWRLRLSRADWQQDICRPQCPAVCRNVRHATLFVWFLDSG